MKRVLLVLILIVGQGPFFQSIFAQEIKVISFNIRNSNAPREDGEYAWPYRINAVCNMIETEKPDLIGMQEPLLNQLTDIDKRLYRKYQRVGCARDNGITRGEFCAIYYNIDRLDLIWQRTRWLSTTPSNPSRGWDAACMRIVTMAHFVEKSTGKSIYYVNTHLDHVGSTARAESIRLIAGFIKKYIPDGAAVIVGGDMNLDSDNRVFEPLRGLGFDSARDIAPRTDFKNTFNGFGKFQPSMVDHFFIRNIQPSIFKTLKKKYGIKYISDHYPIEIIFSL